MNFINYLTLGSCRNCYINEVLGYISYEKKGTNHGYALANDIEQPKHQRCGTRRYNDKNKIISKIAAEAQIAADSCYTKGAYRILNSQL